MAKFETFKTYEGFLATDVDLKIHKMFVKRTDKTITCEDGQRFKIHTDFEGVEFIYPEGRYSMAPTIKASRAV